MVAQAVEIETSVFIDPNKMAKRPEDAELRIATV